MLKNQLVFILIFCTAFWWFQKVFSSSDTVKSLITSQKTLWNRDIYIGTGVAQDPIQYMNEWDNVDITGNYFRWYYYDPIYWFFKLDWSTNKNENVHIKWWSNKCSSWYWYSLRGSAQSETVGKIYFDYNNEYQVYYCLSDNKLHWKAYSPVIWKQDFEWVEFDIFTPITQNSTVTQKSDLFLNDSTVIFYIKSKENLTPIQEENVDEWTLKAFYEWSENIFYIFKTKK